MQKVLHQIVSHDTARTSAAPGFILLAASLLEVFGMAHHPSVNPSDISQAVVEIARYSAQSAAVHGVLIALMLLIVYGLVDFTVRRGLNRPLMRAGAISYGCGVMVMVGAALVDGFIITALASLDSSCHGSRLADQPATSVVVQGSKPVLCEFRGCCDVGRNLLLVSGPV